jgi:hypothetical protein
VSIKNFIKDLSIYHKSISVTTLEALQTAFGAEKIRFAILLGLEGLPPGDEGLAHRVLDQDIRFPIIQGFGGLGPEAQGAGHLFNDYITQISQAQPQKDAKHLV